MPFYDYVSGIKASPGVTPSKDYNAPTPPHNSGDPMQKPDFLLDALEELVAVRQELDQLWAERYGQKTQSFLKNHMYSANELSVSAMQREADYQMRRRKLEAREAELASYCNQYAYVASLGDAPATEDEEGEPANAAESGATSRVGGR